MISGAWDIGTLLANIAVTYVAAKGHRTRWVALGMLIMGFSSFLRTLPYVLYGPGEDIKMYTKEYGYLMNNGTENNGKSETGRFMNTFTYPVLRRLG